MTVKRLERQDILSYIEEIEEFQQLHEFMDDEELDEAMADVVRCIRKPDVPAPYVKELITKLQALSTSFALKASFYMTFGKDGKPEQHKKNVYYSARDAVDKLVNALKYQDKY